MRRCKYDGLDLYEINVQRTGPFTRSFARNAHSFACSALPTLLTPSTALCSFVRLPDHSLALGLMGKKFTFMNSMCQLFSGSGCYGVVCKDNGGSDEEENLSIFYVKNTL